MKVIFIYGPPAVGKLTVAKELAALTDFKLLHNHLTLDVVSSIFDRGSPSYVPLVRKIRFAILEEATRANLPGLIMTFVFSPARQAIVEKYEEVMERNGAEVCYIRLFCQQNVLFERVRNADRKEYGKIVDEAQLQKTLEDFKEPFAAIAGRENLSIDVGELSPREVADMIMTQL